MVDGGVDAIYKQDSNTIIQSQNIHGCTRIKGQKLTKRISESVAIASGVHMAI